MFYKRYNIDSSDDSKARIRKVLKERNLMCCIRLWLLDIQVQHVYGVFLYTCFNYLRHFTRISVVECFDHICGKCTLETR